MKKNQYLRRSIQVLLVLVLLLLLTAGLSLFYTCPIQSLLGVNCPTCGITRAALQLLRFDFLGAWQQNPLIYLLAFYIVLISIEYIAGKLGKNHLFFYGMTFAGVALLRWLIYLFG